MNQSGGGGWGAAAWSASGCCERRHDSAVHSNANSMFVLQFWERKLIKVQVVEGKAGVRVQVFLLNLTSGATLSRAGMAEWDFLHPLRCSFPST